MRVIAFVIRRATGAMIVAAALALGGCRAGSSPPVTTAAPQWLVTTSATGTGIRLTRARGEPIIGIACVSGGDLRVTVPGFTRIGSEDRLSFGFDDDPIALAVEPDGAPYGLTGVGTVPEDIERRIAAATMVTAHYGRQSLGPLPPPDAAARGALVRACTRLSPRPAPRAEPPQAEPR